MKFILSNFLSLGLFLISLILLTVFIATNEYYEIYLKTTGRSHLLKHLEDANPFACDPLNEEIVKNMGCVPIATIPKSIINDDKKQFSIVEKNGLSLFCIFYGSSSEYIYIGDEFNFFKIDQLQTSLTTFPDKGIWWVTFWLPAVYIIFLVYFSGQVKTSIMNINDRNSSDDWVNQLERLKKFKNITSNINKLITHILFQWKLNLFFMIIFIYSNFLSEKTETLHLFLPVVTFLIKFGPYITASYIYSKILNNLSYFKIKDHFNDFYKNLESVKNNDSTDINNILIKSPDNLGMELYDKLRLLKDSTSGFDTQIIEIGFLPHESIESKSNEKVFNILSLSRKLGFISINRSKIELTNAGREIVQYSPLAFASNLPTKYAYSLGQAERKLSEGTPSESISFLSTDVLESFLNDSLEKLSTQNSIDLEPLLKQYIKRKPHTLDAATLGESSHILFILLKEMIHTNDADVKHFETIITACKQIRNKYSHNRHNPDAIQQDLHIQQDALNLLHLVRILISTFTRRFMNVN